MSSCLISSAERAARASNEPARGESRTDSGKTALKNHNGSAPANNHLDRKGLPAVLVLPNWNAKWHGQRGLCEWLQRIGISVLRMSLPYHDRRMAAGHERADQLVGPNIGLTLQANRQAVQDARGH